MTTFDLRALSCGVLLAAGSSLAVAQGQPAPPVVREGVTVKVSEHVYVIPDGKVGGVPNVGIVVGTKGTLVVDPGMGRASGEAVLNEMKKVSKGGELYIVNTHFHPEHTTGELAFPAGAKILRAAVQQQETDEVGVKWVEIFRSRGGATAEVLAGFTSFRAPAEVFEREKVLDLGDVRVRMVYLGPGHTRGDTVIFVEGERVLFSGDLAMKDIFPAFSSPQSSGRTWIAALDEMEKLQPRVVVGAHYPLADGSVINDYRVFLKALQARVIELRKQGSSSDDAAAQARGEFAPKYKDWAQPARIDPAALVFYREAN
jgi:glyoxylase-like metal-dependent hydrolase (beta-lactamase superfamily II)